jgi:hypothetical protein
MRCLANLYRTTLDQFQDRNILHITEISLSHMQMSQEADKLFRLKNSPLNLLDVNTDRRKAYIQFKFQSLTA